MEGIGRHYEWTRGCASSSVPRVLCLLFPSCRDWQVFSGVHFPCLEGELTHSLISGFTLQVSLEVKSVVCVCRDLYRLTLFSLFPECFFVYVNWVLLVSLWTQSLFCIVSVIFFLWHKHWIREVRVDFAQEVSLTILFLFLFHHFLWYQKHLSIFSSSIVCQEEQQLPEQVFLTWIIEYCFKRRNSWIRRELESQCSTVDALGLLLYLFFRDEDCVLDEFKEKGRGKEKPVIVASPFLYPWTLYSWHKSSLIFVS